MLTSATVIDKQIDPLTFVGQAPEPGHYVNLTVEDNGSGFDVESVRASMSSGKGVGLKSMFNRAKLMGAELKLVSNFNKGTRLEVKFLS